MNVLLKMLLRKKATEGREGTPGQAQQSRNGRGTIGTT